MHDSRDKAIEFMASALQGRANPQRLRASVESELKSVLDEFYSQLKRTEIAALFSGRRGSEQLKGAQKKHWIDLFADELADDTIKQSRHIGKIHLQVGLSPSWYVSAYGWVMMKLIPLVTKRRGLFGGDVDAVLCTMVHRLFSDMAASLSGYEQASVEKAVSEMKRANVDNLGKLAQSVAEMNDIVLQLAILQQNSNQVATNGQTISSAATELVASVEAIAKNSESASTEARECTASVTSGRASIEQLSSMISNIANAVDETSGSVHDLSSTSDQIGQILGVIENIAGQTNLLALNATIESARAGAAGKGFAVVAAEVKGLANQTATSTEDIARRIAALRTGMTDIQRNMNASTSAVGEGEEAIGHTSGQMEQIAAQVDRVSSRMSEIANILAQQQDATSEIAVNIGGVADISAENDRLVGMISDSLHKSTKVFLDNAKGMFDSDSDISLCYMAKLDHVVFKQRIIDTCMGKDNWKVDEIPDHHTCRLGRWYDNIRNESVRSLRVFSDLVEPHKAVHAAGKAAVTAAAVHKSEEMIRALQDLDVASKQVLLGLDALADEIAKTEGRQRPAA